MEVSKLRRRSEIKGHVIVCPKCGYSAERKYTDPTKARCLKCYYEFDLYIKK